METKINKLLRKFISIPSVYPNEKELFLLLLNFFKSKKYIVRKQKVASNRYNLIVEKGVGSLSIGLYSHIDTVSVSQNWTKKPYYLTKEGDKGYGLGSYDMKSGMVVNILTFLDSQPKNIKLKLLFCVDEEDISRGAFALLKSNILKGVKCILSPEPALKNGLQGIVVGRVGRASFEIIVKNKPVHYMFYDFKSDLFLFIAAISNQLKKLYKGNGDKRQFIFIRQIVSSYYGISVPDKLIVEIDSSVLAPMTNEMLLGELKKIVRKEENNFKGIKASVNFKKRETPFLSGYSLDENDIFLRQMKEIIKEVTGKKAVPYFRSSVADENVFGAMGISVLGVGPLGANAHGPDEHVELSSLGQLLNIYKRFISNIDKFQILK